MRHWKGLATVAFVAACGFMVGLISMQLDEVNAQQEEILRRMVMAETPGTITEKICYTLPGSSVVHTRVVTANQGDDETEAEFAQRFQALYEAAQDALPTGHTIVECP